MRRRAMALLKVSVTIAVIGLAVWHYTLSPGTLVGPVKIGKLSIDLSSLEIQLLGNNGKSTLISGRWASEIATLSPEEQPRQCPEDRDFVDPQGRPSRCIEWPGKVKLEVSHDKKGGDKCFNIKWTSLNKEYRPQDCFSLSGAYWYGGAEAFTQFWPMNKQIHRMQPYVSGDFLQYVSDPSLGKYGPVLEPYWISSRGVGIHVDRDVTLHASFNQDNDQKLCLRSDPVGHPPEDQYQVLKYDLCYGKDVKEVHSLMSASFIDRPRDIPDERVFRSPIWCTWARYKVHVNQTKVLEFADDINKNGFSNSQLEIDDMYTPYYGDLIFDTKKFPDPRAMIERLKEKGFRVTSWVTPFANPDSLAFGEGTNAGYWIKDATGKVPALVRWWQGLGVILDVTNPDAADWYSDRLQNLRDTTGIDSFKFDAGELNYLPPVETSQTHFTMSNANDYVAEYAQIGASFGKMVEMRSGYGIQKHPIFMRMLDRDSVWGYNNGLKTMITAVLQLGIIGYPFILPDMIGGNGYVPEDMSESLKSTILPSKELYIRWVELNAYLPVMQYSIAPWQYDEETVKICQKYTKIHEEQITPIIIKAAKEAVKTGFPIIRPIWWIAPQDEAALTSDSQFLVSDDILVAPITDEGATMRDIYLPAGTWKDDMSGKEYQGPRLLRNYRIRLEEIATFTRVAHK